MIEEKAKIFKDTVHGYIEIPVSIVKNIIDTEQFQRLKFVEQTSMRPLYPSARHDRFIHSLGVYHLGKQAFIGFKRNTQREIRSLISRGCSINDHSENWWNKQQLLFEIACLMHDCAHAPFSHTFEDYYWMIKGDDSTPALCSLLSDRCSALGDANFKNDFKKGTKGTGAAHEQLSAFIILQEFIEPIKSVFSTLLPDEKVENKDFVFICRMIIGCKYKENSVDDSLKNCIISMLNSSTIDVDGLDYIVRDSRMSGASSFDIDYQRILESFVALPVKNYLNYIAPEKSQIKKEMNGLWLKDTKFIGSFFSGSICGKFIAVGNCNDLKKAIPSASGITTGGYSANNPNEPIAIESLTAVDIALGSTAKIKADSFKGQISGKKFIKSDELVDDNNLLFVLGYDKRCLSIIQNAIDARNNEYLWIYTHPKVQYNSSFLQCELLVEATRFLYRQKKDILMTATHRDEEVNSSNQNIESEEQIQNEYMDFIPIILGYDELIIGEKVNNLKSELKKDNIYFYRSNDDDLNALFKLIYLKMLDMENDKENDRYIKAYQEYFGRKQRKTLWKSFMEKEIFPDACMLDDKKEKSNFSGIKYLLSNYKQRQSSTNKYTSIKADEQAIFDKYGLKDVLVLYSGAKTKKIDFPEFFVRYGDRIVRLCDVFDESMFTKAMEKDVDYIFFEYDGAKVPIDDIINIDIELKEYYGI